MDYIAHHGIKGQRWGDRRYQNEDGSLTTLGRLRYSVGEARKSQNKAAFDRLAVKGSGVVASGRRKLREARLKAMDARSEARSRMSDARLKGTYAMSDAKSALRRGSGLAKGVVKSGIRDAAESAKTASYRLGGMLGTQRSEAERLRRYTDRIVEDRKRSYANLIAQESYKKRRSAAQSFVEASLRAGKSVSEASRVRFRRRTGIDSILGNSLTFGGSDKRGSSGYQRARKNANDRNYVYDTSDTAASIRAREYAESVDSWRRNYRDAIEEAFGYHKAARGR